ncbi:MAG TPA: hypothetical protein VEK74_05465 [Burkholderiaceae bacterium]|nr:hypothetical protein [Burkholderiaceae bacterium]
MSEWEHYWELTGTSAVTLIGLLFVVITLGAERVQHGDHRLLRTYLTPTLVHFGIVFLIALLALSPERDGLIRPFGLIGIAGGVYVLNIMLKLARNHETWDAWLFHGGIPIVCSAGIIAAAWLGVTSPKQAYSILRAVSALLLLAGMRNAWAVAVAVAGRKSK